MILWTMLSSTLEPVAAVAAKRAAAAANLPLLAGRLPLPAPAPPPPLLTAAAAAAAVAAAAAAAAAAGGAGAVVEVADIAIAGFPAWQ